MKKMDQRLRRMWQRMLKECSTKSFYFPIPSEWVDIIKEARLNGSTLSLSFCKPFCLIKEFKRFHQAEYKYSQSA